MGQRKTQLFLRDTDQRSGPRGFFFSRGTDRSGCPEGFFYPRSLQAPRHRGCPERTRESEGTRREKRSLACRRKSQAIFDGRGRKEKKNLGFVFSKNRRIRQIRDRSFPFLMGPDRRSGPVRNKKRAILDLSFPLRGIRQMKIFLSTHEMGR